MRKPKKFKKVRTEKEKQRDFKFARDEPVKETSLDEKLAQLDGREVLEVRMGEDDVGWEFRVKDMKETLGCLALTFLWNPKPKDSEDYDVLLLGGVPYLVRGKQLLKLRRLIAMQSMEDQERHNGIPGTRTKDGRLQWVGPGVCPEDVYAKIEGRSAKTQQESGKRDKVFGFPATAVLRWMGKEGWSKAEARKALDSLGAEVADATIAAQLRAGATGERGPPAALSSSQENDLYTAAAQ